MSAIVDIIRGFIRIADAAGKEAENVANESDKPTKVAVVLLSAYASPFVAIAECDPKALLLPFLIYLVWTALEIVLHPIIALIDR